MYGIIYYRQKVDGQKYCCAYLEKMVKRATRKAPSRNGLVSRLWSPFSHALSAGEETVGAVTNTAKGVVREGARGVNKIGKSVTGHFNAAIHDLIKARKNRKNMTRRNRKNTRRNNRKNTRRNNY
jgi:hypothetical protein